jgi:predicted CopG family antitoxin
MNIMAVTTIPISKEFHDWLKSKGRKGESYEDVIKRLLNPEFQQELGSQESSEDAESFESENQ